MNDAVETRDKLASDNGDIARIASIIQSTSDQCLVGCLQGTGNWSEYDTIQMNGRVSRVARLVG
jgi:hypothetical protein